MKNIITLLTIVFLFSCSNTNKNGIKSILDEKVNYRGEVYNGYEDYELNNILVTTFVDTFPKNIRLSDFLTKRIKEGEFKIIEDVSEWDEKSDISDIFEPEDLQ